MINIINISSSKLKQAGMVLRTSPFIHWFQNIVGVVNKVRSVNKPVWLWCTWIVKPIIHWWLSFRPVPALFSSSEMELNLSTKFWFKSVLRLTAVLNWALSPTSDAYLRGINSEKIHKLLPHFSHGMRIKFIAPIQWLAKSLTAPWTNITKFFVYIWSER